MLTPSDIRNRMLKTTMGGYNKKDTDDFLDSVYQSFEILYKENKDLKDKVASLSDGVQYYKQMENTLQKALILAEKTSTETQEAAKEEAAKLIKETKEKADTLLNNAKAETDALRNNTRTEADTLMSETREKAESLLEEARIQSDLIMTDAKAQAEITKLKARHDFEDVQKCMGNLVKSYNSYYSQLKNLVSSQMELLESDGFKLEIPDINNVIDKDINENEEETNFSWNNTVNNSNGNNDNGNNDDSAATEEVLPDEISSNGEDIEEEQDTPLHLLILNKWLRRKVMGRVITVHYNNKPLYNITIENSYRGLSGILKGLGTSCRKLCIVADSTTGSLYLDTVMDIAKEYADKVVSFIFEAGEQSKNLDTVGNLYEKLISGHFDRKDIILALGGGVTGDLAGFTAATYLRGIRVIQLPTSLLAMVDSSIGGKTGVDFRGYKNMVGSFHQPSAVYINTSTLQTLTDAQYFSGFGEIIKHGLIKDMKYFGYICANIDKLKRRDTNVLEEIIAGSCEIKRAVVENDPEEKGERALLNFGHTLGHAIEKLMDFSMLHGECVAAGMVAASYISMERGMIGSSGYNDICKIIKELNLPLDIKGVSAEEILKVSKNDKKMDAGKIKFILLDGMGNAVIRDDVTDSEMLGALGQVLRGV